MDIHIEIKKTLIPNPCLFTVSPEIEFFHNLEDHQCWHNMSSSNTRPAHINHWPPKRKIFKEGDLWNPPTATVIFKEGNYSIAHCKLYVNSSKYMSGFLFWRSSKTLAFAIPSGYFNLKYHCHNFSSCLVWSPDLSSTIFLCTRFRCQMQPTQSPSSKIVTEFINLRFVLLID